MQDVRRVLVGTGCSVLPACSLVFFEALSVHVVQSTSFHCHAEHFLAAALQRVSVALCSATGVSCRRANVSLCAEQAASAAF